MSTLLMRVSALGTGLALGAVSIVGVTEPAHAQNQKLPAPKTHVFVAGDSLTVGAAPYLRRYARGHARSVVVNAEVGRTTATGIRTLRSGTARRANVWVIALGTNDAPSASATQHNVSRVMRLAGKKRHVIWVNVVRPGSYHLVNRTLRNLDVRLANLSVIDWANFVAKNKSVLSGDRVHLTTRGYQLRGKVIAASVAAL